VSDFPAELDPQRHRELAGRRSHAWIRRAVLAVAAVPVVLALAGLIGQDEATSRATGPAARMDLLAPSHLRGGLLWRARLEIRALRTIDHPRIVLAPGWSEGMQFNTMEPAAQGETGRDDGSVVLSYPSLSPGGRLVVYMQFQVNPTTVGDQDTSVELDDAERPLARIAHTITVLP
jgi:hypothetical protein